MRCPSTANTAIKYTLYKIYSKNYIIIKNYYLQKFRTTRQVKFHEMTHTGNMPYRCGICAQVNRSNFIFKIIIKLMFLNQILIMLQRFQASWNLKSHLTHIHGTKKAYTCHLCPSVCSFYHNDEFASF